MTQIREHWSSRIGFIMAALGSAIGLGILWKFPYTVGQNGGGLFLLTYFACTILVGVPIFITELLIGRVSQRAAVGTFIHLNHGKKGWQVAGWLGVAASFLIMSFYSVIAGYGMSYVLASLTGAFQGMSAPAVAQSFKTLTHSGGISILWHFLFTFITMAIVFSGVRKGIEHWSKIVTRMLLIILFALFAYGLSLEGFSEALHFIFKLDPQNYHLSSAIEALGLAFWTLSIGQGIMISYGSYMNQNTNVIQLASVVAFSVIVVAVLAALTIFPVVFSFGSSPSAGYGLVFETLPYLFAQLPGAKILSTLFFLLFVFTALTSAIPLIEVVATNLMELFGLSRFKATLLVGGSTFLFGLPSALADTDWIFNDWTLLFGMNFLETVNSFVSIWIIPICGLLTALFVGWVMDRKLLKEEFTRCNPYSFLWHPFYLFIRWVVPAMILIIIFEKIGVFN